MSGSFKEDIIFIAVVVGNEIGRILHRHLTLIFKRVVSQAGLEELEEFKVVGFKRRTLNIEIGMDSSFRTGIKQLTLCLEISSRFVGIITGTEILIRISI